MNIRSYCLAAPLLIASASGFAEDVVIDQLDKEFVRDGQVVKSISIMSGDTLVFRNLDPFFHNIFSLSELGIFDLGSFPKGESRSVSFDESGEIEIECAIHPDMYMLVEIQ
jgi:plastocyanin